jgi:phage regulator Rha-like protein
MKNVISTEQITNQIYLIRGKKVMLDQDLAELYGVPTKILNQAVLRNIKRFPEDFLFTLNRVEVTNLRSQFVTSSFGHGGRRYAPRVFTEQGIAMLSSVLRSERAIQVNIQIIRTFTKMREMLSENEFLRRKIEALELHYDEQFKIVFDALRKMLSNSESTNRQIGFAP